MDAPCSIAEYVSNYEFRGEGGDHTPTEAERELLEDAINGFIADHCDTHALVAALKAARPLVSAFGEGSDRTDFHVRQSNSVVNQIDRALHP